MEYIQVTRENIESEHICCAISNNKDVQVAGRLKKEVWVKVQKDMDEYSEKTQSYLCLSELVKD